MPDRPSSCERLRRKRPRPPRRGLLLATCAVLLTGALATGSDAFAQAAEGYAGATLSVRFAETTASASNVANVSARFGETAAGASVATVAVRFGETTASASNVANVAVRFAEVTREGTGHTFMVSFGQPPPGAQLLGRAPHSGFNADPVNTATGNYVLEQSDLRVPGRGLDFEFVRFYNSLDAAAGPLGYGWTHSYNISLSEDIVSGAVAVRWADGHVDAYDRVGEAYVSRGAGVFDELVRNQDGTFTVTQKNQRRYHFAAGRLSAIEDANGNTLSLTYAGSALATVTMPGGRTVSFTTDGAGRITQIADPLPRTVAFAYDGAGDLASVTDTAGGTTTYTYDAQHQMLAATDPRGTRLLLNVYDGEKRVVEQTDANGNLYRFAYDPAAGRTTITDPLGRDSVDYHDMRSRLVRREDRLGESAGYGYDVHNNRTSVTDAGHASTSYGFDERGNVTSKVDPASQGVSITYDEANRPLTRRDALGGTTRFAYDANGNLLSVTDANGQVTAYTYTAWGQRLTETDANGHTTTYAYDEHGHLTAVTDALGRSTLYTYDAVGRRLSETDPLGNFRRFTWDGPGRLLTEQDPLGHTVRHAYDGAGNLVQTVDARDGTWAYSYDGNRQLLTVTDPLGGVTAHTYDAVNNRVSTRNARGAVTEFTYDPEGRLLSRRSPLGLVTSHAYDANGRRRSTTTPDGQTTSFEYDALGRLATITDPLGKSTAIAYDALGRRASTTDPRGRRSSFGYDAVGRLTSAKDASDATVSYEYDPVGNRTAVIDPTGRRWPATFTATNRLLRSSDPLDRHWQSTYDWAGRLLTTTDPLGVTASTAYDANGRVTSIAFTGGLAFGFTYDALGNRTQVTDEWGTSTTTYDALGRPTSHQDALGHTIGYEYDAAGNRTALVYPGGLRAGYAYDLDGRLVSVTDWKGRTTTYAYDAAGRVSRVTHANGTVETLAYDAASRLTGWQHATSGGTVFASASFTLDAAGRRVAAAETLPLQPTLPESSSAMTYDVAAQLTTVAAEPVTYDANGRMTSMGTGAAAVQFQYDPAGRLVRAVGAFGTRDYAYLGDGTRVGISSAQGVRRHAVDPFAPLSQLLVETDGNGTPVAFYVYGLGLLERIQPDGTAFTYHFDARGSTIAITDASQAIVQRFAYDPFGRVVAREGPGSDVERFLDGGRDGVQMEVGDLRFARARYYDAGLGRFLTRDPIEGDPALPQGWNPYVYARNDPGHLSDPRGTFALEALALSAGAGFLVGGLTGVATVVVGDVVSTIYESSREGSLSVRHSTWGEYGGAFLGGGVTGSTLGVLSVYGVAAGGATLAAHLAGGLVEAASGQAIDIGLGTQERFDPLKFIATTAIEVVSPVFSRHLPPVHKSYKNPLTKFFTGEDKSVVGRFWAAQGSTAFLEGLGGQVLEERLGALSAPMTARAGEPDPIVPEQVEVRAPAKGPKVPAAGEVK